MNQQFELKDDFQLLDGMIADSASQPPLYQPGPYWAPKAKNAANEIKKRGLSDFRGSTNLIGQSFADNLIIDMRASFYQNFPRRLARWAANAYPLSKVFEAQAALTKFYADASISYAQEILNLKPETRELLKKYKMPYSLLGNCLTKARIDGQDYSTHYLNLLERHDRLASRVRFGGARSIFEIGGGFGANVHLLLANYENIRKVLYLDIPPNLYVGTQYLKAFYGSAVSDYAALKQSASIQFSANDELEIFCIAPWQIENFASAADIFMNSHSFVEMPKHVVKNYVDKFRGFPGAESSAIALTTYGGYDLDTTFHPDDLPLFFEGRKFERFEADTLLNIFQRSIYFVSPGKLSRP